MLPRVYVGATEDAAGAAVVVRRTDASKMLPIFIVVGEAEYVLAAAVVVATSIVVGVAGDVVGAAVVVNTSDDLKVSAIFVVVGADRAVDASKELAISGFVEAADDAV